MPTFGKLTPDHIALASHAAKTRDNRDWGILGDKFLDDGHEEIGNALTKYASQDYENPQEGHVYHTLSVPPAYIGDLKNGEFAHTETPDGIEVHHRLVLRVPQSDNEMFWWKGKRFKDKFSRRRISVKREK